MSGARGMCQLTKIHAATGISDEQQRRQQPDEERHVRTIPIRAEIASATVTSSTSAPAARVALFGLPGLVCHTSACTMRSTFSSDRVARKSANPADEEREDPLPGREVADSRERLRRQPADPRIAGQAARILARGAGPEPEDHDEQEHVRDHEEEHPERHRAREHASAGGDVALERAQRGVDDLRVRTLLLELFARPLDATDGPRLLQLQALHPRLRDRVVGVRSSVPVASSGGRGVVGHRPRTASMRPSATARSSAAWSATVWSA